MTDADRRLLDQLLDGDLPPAECEAAQRLLETDDEALAYFAERAALASDLRRSLKRRRLQNKAMAVVADSDRGQPRHRGTFRSGWHRSRAAWAAAAAILLLAAGVTLFTRRPATDRETVATDRTETLVDVVDSQGAAPAQNWRTGTRIPVRKIELTSGRIGLRLPTGVLLDLAGPLEAELISAGELRLARGNVIASVADGGKGFVVQTAHARVVDLGTRFGVTADASSATDVVVFDGKVEIADPAQDPSARQPVMTLSEGEAVRFDASRRSRRMKMVALGADADARSLQGAAGSALVEGMKDNLATNDFHRYYGLLPGGMGDGARIYTTGHTRTWSAIPGASFPGELSGADAVCTFSADKGEESLEITIVLKQPCDLYVLADARSPAPEWLRRGFVDTGMMIRSGAWVPRAEVPKPPATAPDDAYVPHAVWKMQVRQPGSVVLGPPRSPGYRGPLVMYGIAVKKVP